jgi:phosphinothricin acetyltransferase
MTPPDAIAVVPLTKDDWPSVRDIYAAGIATGHATFETEPPLWERFDATHLADHCFVALSVEGPVLGWSAASTVSERCVYAGVAEVSVYVHPQASGRGVGRRLLDELIHSTERAGIWTLQAGIFPENAASLALHRAAGFREVGLRERLGQMTYGPLSGEWRDVVLLERRSAIAGR